MKKHKLLSPAQHGFLVGRGCLSNLLETIDCITFALAHGHNVDVILLDFAKAFDKVSHRKLLHKLRAYGVGGKLLDWISDFLTMRKQRVVLGEHASDWSDVKSGVPQGSVLGPILFILFINDMPEDLVSKLKLYADDSKLISVHDRPNSTILTQLELARLVDWADVWLMELNLDKCKVLHFGKKNARVEYIMTNNEVSHVLEASVCERDLGVQLTDNMKWHAQCASAAAKANRVLGMLGRTFVCRDIKVWELLYRSMVRPHLEFAASVWNPTDAGDIDVLERVQHRATRMVKSIRQLSYEQRCKLFGLTSLRLRRARGDMIQMRKLVLHPDELDLSVPLQPHHALQATGPAASTRGHQLRLASEPLFTASRSDGAARRAEFFVCRSVPLWNKLPASVVLAPTVSAFKAALDEFLLNKPDFGA